MADNKNGKLPEQIVNPPSWLSLPSAWDWSLSYAENLRKLVYNVNVIIQYLQDLQTNYEEYTDQKVAELKAYVDAADQALHDYADSLNAAMKTYVDAQDLAYWERHTQDITQLQNNIDALRSYCDKNFEDIRTKHAEDIAQLQGALQAQYEQLTAYTDRQIDVLQAWTSEQLDQIRLEVDEINEDGFRIDNPITGERDHVGNTVNDVFNALRVHAITCDEFDAWFTYYGNDCDSFRNLFISAIDFDTRARLLMYAQYDEQVNSPATGMMISHAQALEEIMSFSSEQALDCTDRDGLDLTCAEIFAKNWEAFQWDTESVGYFNTENFKIIKKLIGFIVLNKNVAWRGSFETEPALSSVNLYPYIPGWHYQIMNLSPIFQKNDGTNISVRDINVNCLSYDATGAKITQAIISFGSNNTNQAYLTDFRTDILDVFTNFNDAKGGLIA